MICGHSLGGAIASLLCARIFLLANKKLTNKELLCVTFGAPPAGDNNFTKYITADHQQDITQSNFIHVVHEGDIVPRIMYILKSLKKYISGGSVFSNSEKIDALRDASGKLKEALISDGSRSSLLPTTFDRFFGENPFVHLRKILGSGYKVNMLRKSLIQIIFSVVINASIADYESFGCVLLFPTGTESNPHVCVGDIRTEIENNTDLYAFDSCTAEWHYTNVYLSSVTEFVEKHYRNRVTAIGPYLDTAQRSLHLTNTMLDLLSLRLLPSFRRETEKGRLALAIWKLRHYSVKAWTFDRNRRDSFFLAEDSEKNYEGFIALMKPQKVSFLDPAKRFSAMKLSAIDGSIYSGSHYLPRLLGLQLVRTLCALYRCEVFVVLPPETLKNLFTSPKATWGWLSKVDIELVRPYIIAILGKLFDGDTKFQEVFRFFHATENIIPPLTDFSGRPTQFKMNDLVDVNYNGDGKWYRGKIIAVGTPRRTYKVHFNGGHPEIDVDVERLKVASLSGFAMVFRPYLVRRKVFIVLEQGVLSYRPYENWSVLKTYLNFSKPLYLKNCGARKVAATHTVDIFVGDDLVLQIGAVLNEDWCCCLKGGPTLDEWETRIKAHIDFANGQAPAGGSGGESNIGQTESPMQHRPSTGGVSPIEIISGEAGSQEG